MGFLEPHGRYRRGHGQASIIPRLVFTGYAEAVSLLETAQHKGQPIALITPEGASRYMGAAWFAALQNLLAAHGSAEIIYDCAARTGDVLAALRHGIRVIRIDPAIYTTALADLALKHGAIIYTDRNPGS